MRALRRVFVLVLALALSVPIVVADFQAHLEAYKRGDYATALEEWHLLRNLSSSLLQEYFLKFHWAMQLALREIRVNLKTAAASK